MISKIIPSSRGNRRSGRVSARGFLIELQRDAIHAAAITKREQQSERSWAPPWILERNKMSDLPYRPNVCLLVHNGNGKLFLGERAGEPGVWQLPQGGLEADCSIEENVLRELEEELGADQGCFRVVKRLDATHQYDFSAPPAYAIGKWRGQDQIFYLVEFTGTDLDINLTRFHQEFMSYQWVTVPELKHLAEPKRLAGYLGALVEFEEYFYKR